MGRGHERSDIKAAVSNHRVMKPLRERAADNGPPLSLSLSLSVPCHWRGIERERERSRNVDLLATAGNNNTPTDSFQSRTVCDTQRNKDRPDGSHGRRSATEK